MSSFPTWRQGEDHFSGEHVNGLVSSRLGAAAVAPGFLPRGCWGNQVPQQRHSHGQTQETRDLPRSEPSATLSLCTPEGECSPAKMGPDFWVGEERGGTCESVSPETEGGGLTETRGEKEGTRRGHRGDTEDGGSCG